MRQRHFPWQSFPWRRPGSVRWPTPSRYTLISSGYSDMAIGLGKMFGFHFLENFNYPYISRSITEFWRRWHISLSSWFREYVYIPLGGNRKGLLKQVRNIFVVWMLTGIWHGAHWNYVLWGVYYGVLLILENLC
ncbi:MAG: MBOAT family O-acyltransferase [Lachnospiraceae bacterium]